MSNNILSGLKPHSVFNFFEEIAAIPRGSGNEKGISDYLVKFAKDRGLEVIQDSVLNVIIKKKGTKGYENAPTVIIQGHMDMVCEKNSSTVHDFKVDPIKLEVDGDMIKAVGTTLGADNGIAIAYAMALLDSKDVAHPPIEVLITTDEETGMSGAGGINPENIDGRILINIDNEEEGQLLVSCAGGVRTKVQLPIQWEEIDSAKYMEYVLKVRKLKGGHSGMDINKERGNSNKIIGRILIDLLNKVDIRILKLNGGSKDNAIPREADLHICINNNDVDLLEQTIKQWHNILKNEYKSSDSDLSLELDKVDVISSNKAFTKECGEKTTKLLYLIPNGIKTMNIDIAGLVQSSSNLGIVRTLEDSITFESAVRSSIKSLKNEIVTETQIISEAFGAEVTIHAEYPEWQYDKESKIRTLFQETYKKKYGVDAKIVAIHAGVECGIIKEKFGEIDMISFGPNLYDVHTPDERMSISSVQRTWEYLIDVLKEIK